MTTWEYCLVDKAIIEPFKKRTRVETRFQFIHFDICDSISVIVKQEALYFSTIIDDFTYDSHDYLISHN